MRINAFLAQLAVEVQVNLAPMMKGEVIPHARKSYDLVRCQRLAVKAKIQMVTSIEGPKMNSYTDMTSPHLHLLAVFPIPLHILHEFSVA